MKAVLSNRIYLEVDSVTERAIREVLTYSIPTYGDGPPMILNNVSTFRPGILSIPIGRTDLIPPGYEIVDKRLFAPTIFPKFNGELRETQQEIYDDADDNCLINAKVGWGKAQPGTSKIKIPRGWTTMADILIGDQITTPTNTYARVTGKYFHSNKKIYKITLEDNRTVEACEDHLWKTINPNNLEKILTTEQILNSTYFSTGRGMYLPLPKPINEPAREHIIHPYIMGVILGDGCISHNQVMISSADKELIDKVQSLLPKNHIISHVANYDYRITSIISGAGSNIILNELRLLKLQGTKSFTKFIPEQYLQGTLQNKIDILQGLLDTDGCVDKGNTIDYNTVSPRLAEGFRQLIFALGGVCSLRTKRTTHQDCFELSPKKLPFDIKKQLFSLKRKVARIRPGQYDNCNKIKIKNIEFIRYEDCWCISLDSKDKLYLTDNYIVTHNTFMALALAAKLGQKTLIVVHTLPLMHQWAKEIEKVFGFKPGLMGGGHSNMSTPIVVGNVGTLERRTAQICKEFGTLIMDEVHHAPSRTFAKIVNGSYARYKIGLSGTLERKDGLHVVIPDYFGHKVYKPPKENTLNPIIHAYDTKIMFPYGDIWAHRINALKQNPAYVRWIIDTVAKYEKLGHRVLIVSDRVDFLKFIAAQTGSALTIGETEDRESELNKIYTGESTSMSGTLSIWKEGISCNPLSCLILATPTNNMPMLEQVIGRIQRLHPGKPTPIVVDPILRGRTTEKQFTNRSGFYMREGWEIKYL